MDLEINMAFISLTPSSLMMSPCLPPPKNKTNKQKKGIGQGLVLSISAAASLLFIQASFLPKRNDAVRGDSLV